MSGLRVGIVGLGWMGQVHARALRRLGQHYPELGEAPELVAFADTVTDERVAGLGRAYGFTRQHTDWRGLVTSPDIDLVSVTGPNFIHRDVAVAAAEAGKHIWIEKPAGRTAEETREIADAVRTARVHTAAGFNYRNAPAVEHARALVAAGRLGAVTNVEVTLFADYSAHPDQALSWRFVNRWAGSGVRGDLVSHGVDLARYVVGEITEVICDEATFIPTRPQLTAGGVSHFSRGEGEHAPVENEDYVAALLRFAGGARGVLQSSRTSVGDQCTYGFTVHGERGALSWDFRRMGELQLCVDQDYQNASYATWLAVPGAGELARFQPAAGVAMSYDDLKVIEAYRLVSSIRTGVPSGATIEDALIAARLVDAMAESARERRWVTLG